MSPLHFLPFAFSSGAQLVYNVQGDGVTRVPGSPATAPEFLLNPADGTVSSDYLVTAAPVGPSPSGSSSGSASTLPVQQEVVVHFVNYLDVQTVIGGAANGSLSRQEKMTPGAYIPLDSGDWNYNGAPDMNEPAPASGDLFLLPVKLHAIPNAPAGAVYTVLANGGLRVTSSLTANWQRKTSVPANAESTIWVEGVDLIGTGLGNPGLLTLDLQLNPNKVLMVQDQANVTVFQMTGAMDVPGNGTYSYSATGNVPSGAWIAPTGGAQVIGPVQGQGAPDPNTISIKWDNTPIVGYANYQADADYMWPYAVNVVQISVETNEVTYYSVVTQGNVYYYDQNTVVSGIPNGAILANLRPMTVAVYADALVTVTGPVVEGKMRGLSHIDFGFVQNITFTELNSLEDDGTQLVSQLQGKTYVDGASETSVMPWFCSTNAYQFAYGLPATYVSKISDAAGTQTFDIGFVDGPGAEFAPSAGTFALSSPLVYANVLENFNTFIVAHTSDAPNGSASVYVPEAQLSWHMNGSGSINSGGVWSGVGAGVDGDTVFEDPSWDMFTTGTWANLTDPNAFEQVAT